MAAGRQTLRGHFVMDKLSTSFVDGRRKSRAMSTSPADILFWPILPGMQTAKTNHAKRRTSLPVIIQSRGAFQQQASNQRGGAAQSTNINFKGWYKTPRKEAASDHRLSTSRPNASLNLSEGRSKISYVVAVLENGLKQYPQLRPSICTVITGSILLVCAILVITVPVLREATVMWANLLVLVCACCVVVGGFVGLAVHYRRIHKCIKRERTVVVPMTELRRLDADLTKITSKPRAGSMETVLEERCPDVLEVSAATANCNRDDDTEANLLRVPTKHQRRRKLPGSPLTNNMSSTALAHHQHRLPPVKVGLTDVEASDANHASRPIRIAKRSAYFSSEPDLLGSVSESNDREPLTADRTRAKELEYLKHFSQGEESDKQHKVKMRQAPKNIRLTRNDACCPRVSIDLETANQIFDVYHDPLLFKAITRLNYQCDFEFISVSRK